MESYARILGVFLGYYQGLEAVLGAKIQPLLANQRGSYRYLYRAKLIQADLRDLARQDAGNEPVSGPYSFPPPRIETAAQALGFLYVLEGATQGGRIIAPRVTAQLGLSETCGARYFHLFTHRQWQGFRELALDCASQFDPQRVLAGAQEAFQLLSAHLDARMCPADRNGNHGPLHPS